MIQAELSKAGWKKAGQHTFLPNRPYHLLTATNRGGVAVLAKSNVLR